MKLAKLESLVGRRVRVSFVVSPDGDCRGRVGLLLEGNPGNPRSEMPGVYRNTPWFTLDGSHFWFKCSHIKKIEEAQ